MTEDTRRRGGRRTARGRALLVAQVSLGVLLLIAFILWIMSMGDSVFWIESIHTQVTFKYGVIEWWGRRQYWHYDPSRTAFALAVLLAASLLYRELQTLVGLATLALLVNILSCGYARCELAVPVAFVFDLLLLRMMIRRVAEPKAPLPGICHVCGYDLRATPERCPECGTKVFVILER